MAYVLMGVPEGLRRDGWWLDDAQPEGVRPMRRWPWGALLGLLLLADLLFWRQVGPGLSLALFLMALALAAAPSRRVGPLTGLVLGLLPLVETVQALSVLFGVAAVLGFVLTHHLPGKGLLRAGARFLPLVPFLALRDGVKVLRGMPVAGPAPLRALKAVALPLGLGLVFASLLAEANPVLDGWARQVLQGPDPTALINRVMFWGGMALLIWPVLVIEGEALRLGADPKPFKRHPMPALGLVTAQSVTISLLLFNLMFAVQTTMDLTYLWSGTALPDGMSHAEYAHRGAYPLVATALLAGAFALISRPFAGESRGVRVLLLAWVAQNVMLVISALYRLDLYVETYGLTYLRAHAAVWMGLVALGLVLVGGQVARGLPNGWLMARAAGLGGGVLYVCTFINFAGLIADYNLTAAREGRLTYGPDMGYVCELGPNAWAAMAEHIAITRLDPCSDMAWYAGAPPRIEGWRDWSFRSWRVLRAAAWIEKGANLAHSGRG